MWGVRPQTASLGTESFLAPRFLYLVWTPNEITIAHSRAGLTVVNEPPHITFNSDRKVIGVGQEAAAIATQPNATLYRFTSLAEVGRHREEALVMLRYLCYTVLMNSPGAIFTGLLPFLRYDMVLHPLGGAETGASADLIVPIQANFQRSGGRRVFLVQGPALTLQALLVGRLGSHTWTPTAPPWLER